MRANAHRESRRRDGYVTVFRREATRLVRLFVKIFSWHTSPFMQSSADAHFFKSAQEAYSKRCTVQNHVVLSHAPCPILHMYIIEVIVIYIHHPNVAISGINCSRRLVIICNRCIMAVLIDG
jgi:hypothetical protein